MKTVEMVGAVSWILICTWLILVVAAALTFLLIYVLNIFPWFQRWRERRANRWEYLSINISGEPGTTIRRGTKLASSSDGAPWIVWQTSTVKESGRVSVPTRRLRKE